MTVTRLLLPLSLALLAACSHQSQRGIELNSEGECPQRLQVGQRLNVALPSNPTTGYRWILKDSAAAVLQARGPEVYSSPEQTGMVGTAGISTWRFQATASGEGTLLLVYQQPWAPEVVPVQRFECKVIVR